LLAGAAPTTDKIKNNSANIYFPLMSRHTNSLVPFT
jgi:hypothetical protein